ncbi:MAG: hypothetical protein AAGC49_03455 [Brevundimonas sp.]
MTHVIDWSRWRQLRDGTWTRIAPPVCPTGHPWAQDGPQRPRESFVTCDCTTAHTHTLWTCPGCGMPCAQDCRDTSAWHPSTVPVQARTAGRGTV